MVSDGEVLLHAYLHHRVGYLHDVYLAGGYGEVGGVALGGQGASYYYERQLRQPV